MGTISSGVGLLSGFDYGTVIEQLMAIEARPRTLLQGRVQTLDAQRTAFTELSARITALVGRVSSLSSTDQFRQTEATSSDTALTASTSAGAAPGSYTFRVESLASSHQLASRGFRSPSAILPAGDLVIESSKARINGATLLDELNGYRGVVRGDFEITDADGDTAVVSITDATTLRDVVSRINAADVDVTASVSSEGLSLEGAAGVRDIDAPGVTASLGFAAGAASVGGTLQGASLMSLGADTPLTALNDGLGLRGVNSAAFEIRMQAHTVNVDLSAIVKPGTRLERLNRGRGVDLGVVEFQMRDGARRKVDLTGAKTLDDIKSRIEQGTEHEVNGEMKSGVSVTFNGSRLRLTDTTEPPEDDDGQVREYDFKVIDISGNAARDLGIDEEPSETFVRGRDILFMETVGDLLSAINFSADNFVPGLDTPLVTASIASDGERLVLDSAESMELVAGSGSALQDIGFQAGTYKSAQAVGGRVLSALDGVLLSTLNGGRGFDQGQMTLEVEGQAVTVDTANIETLPELIETLNQTFAAQGWGYTVGYNGSGSKLQITADATETRELAIRDDSGDLATTTGLAGSGLTFTSNNLQRQYIAENTTLEALTGGKPVKLGSIEITDSNGFRSVVNFSSATTLEDVIDTINSSAAKVEARINDTGDGLVIIDQAGGTEGLEISDRSGTLARDLRIAGDSRDGVLDGSLEFRFTSNGQQTLEDLAQAINAQGAQITANILNDGTAATPYRLNVSSTITGAESALLVDASDPGLALTTLTEGKDARIVMGDGLTGITLTSSTNTFEDVATGVSLTVNDIADDPVTVTVNEKVQGVVDTLSGFVSDYNAVLDRLDEISNYDPETEQRAVLFGDSAISTIESRLFSMMTGSVTGLSGAVQRWSQVGVTFGGGGRLEFDEATFREAYQDERQGVISFFTNEQDGRGVHLEERLETITGDDGIIDRRNDTLNDQRELLTNRITQMDELLERKRDRLTRQYIAMERALADLQGQQAALGSLSSLAAGASVSAPGGS